MATPKSAAKRAASKTPVRKTETKKPETDEAPVPVAYTTELLSRHPALRDVERKAFASQCKPAAADALGVRTQSDAVAAEGRRALRRGERMLVAYPGDIKYTIRRLVYLATRQLELEQKIAQQKRARNNGGSAVKPEDAEAAARKARTELIEVLEEVLEGNEGYEGRLAALRGEANTRVAVIDSINRAVTLGTEVLADHDPELAVLIEDHGLDRALIDAATSAGRALRNAIDGRSDERTQGDLPEVNRAEGYVLFELRKLRRALDRAKLKNKLIDRYVPSQALRAVIGGGQAHAPKDEAPVAPPVAPVAPPT